MKSVLKAWYRGGMQKVKKALEGKIPNGLEDIFHPHVGLDPELIPEMNRHYGTKA